MLSVYNRHAVWTVWTVCVWTVCVGNDRKEGFYGVIDTVAAVLIFDMCVIGRMTGI